MTRILWLLAGGVVGGLSMLSLWWTVTQLRPTTPGRAALLALGGTILRWGLAAGLLIAALQQGIGTALLAFAGLWVARWAVVLWTYGAELWKTSSPR
jgi:hypothetical protein